MSWLGTNSLRIEVPDQWPHFTGTGRVYAHSPDCRSGFVFTVWPVTLEEASAQSVSEQKLTSLIGEGIGPILGPFARSYQQPIKLVRSDDTVRGERQGCPAISRSGIFMCSGDAVGFAVVALHAPTDVPPFSAGDRRYAPNIAAAMVVANSLEGLEAATELGYSVASSCVRAPAAAAAVQPVSLGKSAF
jgi:hypothetical protein